MVLRSSHSYNKQNLSAFHVYHDLCFAHRFRAKKKRAKCITAESLTFSGKFFLGWPTKVNTPPPIVVSPSSKKTNFTHPSQSLPLILSPISTTIQQQHFHYLITEFLNNIPSQFSLHEFFFSKTVFADRRFHQQHKLKNNALTSISFIHLQPSHHAPRSWYSTYQLGKTREYREALLAAILAAQGMKVSLLSCENP